MMYTLEDIEENRVWLHKKGGLYHVIGVATCSTNGERDKKEVSVIYFSIKTQKFWYRELSEFCDGRFTPVPAMEA